MDDTAERILEAAAGLFAEKGFKASTTREIAKRAGVNIASLHYHFHDKRGLYMAVFDAHAEALLKEVPMLDSFPAGISAERRFELLIRSIVKRLLLKGSSPVWQLTMRELLEPQGPVDIIVERVARPQFRAMLASISELLGPKASNEDARLCAMSVISQIVIHRLARPMIERVMPEQRYEGDAGERLAAHIFEFSLGAVKARKAALERAKRRAKR